MKWVGKWLLVLTLTAVTAYPLVKHLPVGALVQSALHRPLDIVAVLMVAHALSTFPEELHNLRKFLSLLTSRRQGRENYRQTGRAFITLTVCLLWLAPVLHYGREALS